MLQDFKYCTHHYLVLVYVKGANMLKDELHYNVGVIITLLKYSVCFEHVNTQSLWVAYCHKTQNVIKMCVFRVFSLSD